MVAVDRSTALSLALALKGRLVVRSSPTVRFMRQSTVAAIIAGVCFLTAGCAAGEVSGNERPRLQPAEPDWEESAAAAQREIEREPMAQPWSCGYSPTYDDDWHNDVLCTNGSQSERPYLLEGDSFITQDEIMAAARDYEAMLNSSLGSWSSSKPKKRHRQGRFEDSWLQQWANSQD